MVWVPGGTFQMGDARFYPEERPVHRVSVGGFWMDAHTVTNAQFRRFVAATGYVTVAERPLDPGAYPGADPALLQPGSLVFHKTAGPVNVQDYTNWWAYMPGAQWRRPQGPQSSIAGKAQHPVVHLAAEDAEAYARWAGKALPTEAEWEFAARGGLDGARFAWGDDEFPGGRVMANFWQGRFPWENTLADGFAGTAPVGSFPPNGYGLFDMTGNVWEWTADWFTPRHPEAVRHSCCVPVNPRGGTWEGSLDPASAGAPMPRRVIKGGSHLCAANYCLRYRPDARQGEAIDSSTCHLGFRCVVRDRA
jgi:formylglycine-generating enzyme required for sulfatase activity